MRTELLRFSDAVERDPLGDAPFGCVNTFTSHVNVGFFHGASLPDPARLLQGTGKFMRHVKLRPGTATNAAALRRLIDTAYSDISRCGLSANQTHFPPLTSACFTARARSTGFGRVHEGFSCAPSHGGLGGPTLPSTSGLPRLPGFPIGGIRE